MKRVHIVGCPRSGTTLALEVMVNAYAIDRHFSRETSIFEVLRLTDGQPGICCSKYPSDVLFAHWLLQLEPDLYFVYLLRDPRDVIVSRHRKAPDRYWANLRIWRTYERAARALDGHPRFVIIRYEDLAGDPERTQEMICGALPFLELKADVAEFFRTARPSKQSEHALGELRPLSTSSIGVWRDHKPRLVAQMVRHGSLVPDLVARAYEPDDSWTRELEGVTADFGPSFWPEHRFTPGHFRRRLREWRRFARYLVRRRPRSTVPAL